MKIFKNTILFLVLLSNYIYACPTCNLVSTTVHTEDNVTSQKDHTLFTIQWKFPKKFLHNLIKHDKNKNGTLDKNKQKEIQNDFDKSWKEHNFYTFVKLLKKNEKLERRKSDTLTLLATKLVIKKDFLIYETKLKSDIVLQKDHYIYLRHFDKKMHYLFRLDNVILENYSDNITVKKKKYIAHIEYFKQENKNSENDTAK